MQREYSVVHVRTCCMHVGAVVSQSARHHQAACGPACLSRPSEFIPRPCSPSLNLAHTPAPPARCHIVAGSPLCTLAAAADAVAGGGPGTTVVLRGGAHRINATIHLDTRHSGTTWVAAPGERPVVTSGVVIPHTSWSRTITVTTHKNPAVLDNAIDPPPSAWTTPIPAPAAHSRSVYVNGLRAMRTVGNASEIFGVMTPVRPQTNASVGLGYAVSRAGAKVCACAHARSFSRRL
jgi:hypothetical protein